MVICFGDYFYEVLANRYELPPCYYNGTEHRLIGSATHIFELWVSPLGGRYAIVIK